MTSFINRNPKPEASPPHDDRNVRSRLFPKGTIWILLLFSTLSLCIALVGISWRAAELARADLQTEIREKAEIEARVLGEKIENALKLGIPLREIVGFETVVYQLRNGDPDLVFAALTTTSKPSEILHTGGLPPNEIAATLHAPEDGDIPYIVTHLSLPQTGDHDDIQVVLGHARAALMRPVIDNLYDIAIIFIITLALSFELMLLVLTVNVALPVRVARKVLANVRERKFTLLHGQSTHDEIGKFMERINSMINTTAQKVGTHPRPEREVKLIGVRMLAFMFVLAEELARPIMPTFFSQVTSHSLDGQLGAGVVMAVHLLMIAIAMPICSLFQEQVGSLRMYLCGAFLATLGLIGTAFAVGIWDLVLWRALSGIGYATTFVACQSYVLDATNDSNRTQGTAMMVSGIMLADICGPAIGGIIAGHFGPDMTFIAGATIAFLAVVLAFFLMDNMVRGVTTPPIPTRAALRSMLGNRRLQVLIVFAAIPAKLILSGFLYYLTPIILLQSGATTAEIGRVIMLYGLTAILTGWIAAKWTDKNQNETRAVGIGGGLTAAGLLLAGWMPEYALFAVAVALLGLAQASSIPAQLSASLKLSKEFTKDHGTGPVLAVLRLAERLGGAIGPLLAAGLTLLVGATQAVLIFGVFAAFAVLCFELLIGHVPSDRPTAPKNEGGEK